MAVKGLDRFIEYLSGHRDAFVLIGGTACDMWFTEQNLLFRATKDLDVVLILEKISPAFVSRFWTFIRDGQYQIKNRSEGESPVLYRFEKPVAAGFPFKVELFCRYNPGLDIDPEQRIVPIRMEDAQSLSAILLHDSYYGFLIEHCRESRDILVADAGALIPLKARAWLDLTARKATGEKVDERDIKKHRYDVFRLAVLLPDDQTVSLPEELANDVSAFLNLHAADHSDWESIRNAIRPTVGGSILPGKLISAIRGYFKLGTISN
jgi:hypothetical protein